MIGLSLDVPAADLHAAVNAHCVKAMRVPGGAVWRTAAAYGRAGSIAAPASRQLGSRGGSQTR